MRKILHLINGELFAGAERVQDLLALNLPGHGYQLGFACLKPGAFKLHRRSHEAPLHEFAMKSRFDLSQVGQIVELIRHERYEAVHTHTMRNALVGRIVSAVGGVPLVHHVHSPAARDTERGMRNRLNALVENRLVFPAAAHLIPVSASLRDYVQTSCGVAHGRISVVCNGVLSLVQQSRWQGPAPGDEWVIGTMALFRPRKGLEVLMRSVAALRGQGVRVRLRAVGGFETPEYAAQVKALEAQLGLQGAVDWTGFTRDIGAEFSQMHVFALPSLFGEGLPMVLIEAMGAGLPVVASEVEGIPEVIDGPGVGALVPAGDVGRLAQALGSLVSGAMDARAIAAAGHARQMKRFSDHAMAEGVAAVYAAVLGFRESRDPVQPDADRRLGESLDASAR